MTKLVAPVKDGEVGQFKLKPPPTCLEIAGQRIRAILIYAAFFAAGFGVGYFIAG